MPKYKISKNSTTTWSIEEDDRNWLLTPRGSITTHDGSAVVIAPGADGNRVSLRGDVTSTGPGAMAVAVRGGDTLLSLGGKASIEASIGIHNVGAGNHFELAGDVLGLDSGIRSLDQVAITVSGRVIGGHHGIALEGTVAGSGILVAPGGVIAGSNAAISITDGMGSQIVNYGKLQSDVNAIAVDIGDVTIINRGEIYGNIETGDGNDTFDLKRGSITGEVRGQLGDDQYHISKATVTIVEDVLGGYDAVYATASFTLADNIEMAVLRGKRTIDVTGNDGDNVLLGSLGNNVINGAGGIDMIGGREGNDILTGGGQADSFIYMPGSGKDRITDFTNGEDEIRIWNYAEIDGFAALELRMEQKGADVWITLEGKDRIILENVSLLDLDEPDFWIDPSIS